MRLIKVIAPEGQGKKVIDVALKTGVSEATFFQVEAFGSEGNRRVKDVVELQTSTDQMKDFVDNLMEAPFFNSRDFSFAVRNAPSIIKDEKIDELIRPIVIPDTDIYEELYQFSLITYSFIGRILVASFLLSYGMIKMSILGIVSGLLFMPYVHQMLSTSFGLITGEWKIAKQGGKALLTATVLVMIASAIVAIIVKEPMRFQDFGTPVSGFLIALVIGIAAGLATSDDSGRKELIGLALSSQTTIFPAWIGASLILGFPSPEKTGMNILSYIINMITIIISSGITFRLLKIGRKPFRMFLKEKF